MVEDALAAGGVTVAVACHTLVDFIVVDLRVEESLDASLQDGEVTNVKVVCIIMTVLRVYTPRIQARYNRLYHEA